LTGLTSEVDESGSSLLGERAVWQWGMILLALAAVIRLVCVAQNSLWIDEYASLVTARFPLGQIPDAALRGNAFEPPVYFWVLHLVIERFGDSEATLRAISVVSGAITVPLVLVLIRALGGSSGTAVLGSALLVVHPLHLWYSQEARPYALLVCWGVGALVCLHYGWRQGRAWGWIGFAILGSLAVLTHLSGAAFPLIGCVWVMRSRDRLVVARPLSIALLAMTLATAPFGYHLAYAVAHATGTGSPARHLTGLELPYTLLTYLGGYSFGPSVREIQYEGPRAAVLHNVVECAILAAAFLAATILILRLRSRAAVQLGVLCVLPMAAAGLGALLTGKAYNVRYAVPGIIGFVGLVAMGISALPGSRRRLLAISFAFAVSIWADVQWFVVPRYWKEDSRATVAWLQANLPPGAIVAVAPGYQADLLTYYARREAAALHFTRLPDTTRVAPWSQVDAIVLTRLHHVPYWREIMDSADARAHHRPHPMLEGYEAIVLSR
jgi:mannosyltransferase